MHRNRHLTNTTMVSSASLDMLNSSALNKITEAISKYEAAYAAELQKLTVILYSKLDQVMGRDIEHMKTRLLTITDFIYRQILKYDENTFLSSILDCIAISECEHKIDDIKKDLKNRIHDRNSRITAPVKHLNGIYEITASLSSLNGNYITIEAALSTQLCQDSSMVIRLSVSENGVNRMLLHECKDCCEASACFASLNDGIQHLTGIIDRFVSDALEEMREKNTLLNLL